MKVFFRKSYPWILAVLFFVGACGVKWFVLARQDYFIRLSDELPGAYHLAMNYSLMSLLGQIFWDCNCTLNSVRPFFTTLLYVLAFKSFGFGPQTALTLGIIIGSLLPPLYYAVIRRLLNGEVAIFSSLVLLFMSNYISQSLALTTILPGILFITGALWMMIRFYQKKGVGNLYGAGALLSMSVFCRYENVLWLLPFIGYVYFFDKVLRPSRKLLFTGLCICSGLFILYCNYRVFGDFFHMIKAQEQIMRQMAMRPLVSWREAFEILSDLLRILAAGWVWFAALGGAIVMTRRYTLRALWFFGGALFVAIILVYKIKNATLDLDTNYFLMFALFALPLGLEFVRVSFVGLGGRHLYGSIALGIATLAIIYAYWTIDVQVPDLRLKCPNKFLVLNEALQQIPETSTLYIDNDLNQSDCDIQTILVYLRRDPQKYQYLFGRTTPLEEEYYFLTKEDQIDRVPKKEAVKVRDYRDLGLENVVLYRIIQYSERK